MEIHVAEIGVLGDVEADGDRGRVALADLEVDVAHRRVERAGVGVGDGVIGRHAARRRKWNAASSAPDRRDVSR